ncbi:MAG: CRISPR-associated ring nuclease Csm6 [Burkholderiales bacterium]
MPRQANPANPSTYKRRRLLIASGLSPQIVTETLFALAKAQQPFHPTEMFIATTRAGLREVETHLLDSGDDQLGKLRRDYNLPPIKFGERHVLCLRDMAGNALEDAHDDEAFGALGDTVMAKLAEWSRDEDCAVHVSLAGGRKTMGFMVGALLAMFARPQDRLSHVLVDQPFERIRTFFYPPPRETPVTIETRPGEHSDFDLSKARVQLAEIPFIRFRTVLPNVLLDHADNYPYREVIRRGQQSLEVPALAIDTAAFSILCGGHPLPLTDEEHFAFVCTLAARGKVGITPRALHDDDMNAYLDWYERVIPGAFDDRTKLSETHPRMVNKRKAWFETRGAVFKAISDDTTDSVRRKKLINSRAADFTEMCSRYNKLVEETLGPFLAPRYKVITVGPRGAVRYLLPPDLKVEFKSKEARDKGVGHHQRIVVSEAAKSDKLVRRSRKPLRPKVQTS